MLVYRGFTLLELLITLVLFSFALAFAIPSLSDSIQRSAVYNDSKQLLHLVRLARQQAVFGGERVVVCALNSDRACTRDWSKDLVVFTDANNNNRVDGNDRVLRQWHRNEHHTAIRWSGFGSGYLRFRQSGYAAENGAFTLCPVSGDISKARQLVVNRVGRAYISRDRDGDGIVEYGNDREPAC